MNLKNALHSAAAVSVMLVVSAASFAADEHNTSASGKEKATAIGAATGAVAGGVIAGPVGAVVGAGVGGVVGHEGTDANGKIATSSSGHGAKTASIGSDSNIRDAQSALNDQGYNPGAIDGRWGPSTQSAVRRFQAEHGLAQSGRLDSATMQALGSKG
jgi:hypothetical protein